MKKKHIIILVASFVLIFILILFFNSRYWNLETCNSECIHRGYNLGNCRWASEMNEDAVSCNKFSKEFCDMFESDKEICGRTLKCEWNDETSLCISKRKIRGEG